MVDLADKEVFEQRDSKPVESTENPGIDLLRFLAEHRL